MQQLPRLRPQARKAWVAQWVSAGDDLNAPDSDGVTPLIMAAQRGQSEIVALLVRHGAQLDTRDRRGYTALAWAARRGDHTSVSCLLAHGADPHHNNALGAKLMVQALQRGDLRMARLLRLGKFAGGWRSLWRRALQWLAACPP